MLRDDRGIALVTVIMMTACIMAIVTLVAYKVLRSTTDSVAVKSKAQTYHNANAGLENARLILNDQYKSSEFWHYFLDPDSDPNYSGPATDPDQNKNLFLRATGLVPANFGNDPDLSIDVFVKDNDDGDGTNAVDTDQLILVNVRAQRTDGAVTMIESRLLFDDSEDSYSQAGGGPGKEHYRNVSGIGDAANLGTSTESFKLGD
ncbi:hypothetical protein EDC39_10191 [Geothermobacter ehrlichii]|uniref:PilX-like prepilin protein n=1 Tax=Geothermobacter ehrlichii TaxID=213224 RepID=A0A5D3WMY5_9BACT|nr:hypothetical protein [Geothermobacter ehrlichii]TYO99931.1 hypothetical protein EDC39_10191 [Geothermobacter ehrlichii]